jgi:hypothetical protein
MVTGFHHFSFSVTPLLSEWKIGLICRKICPPTFFHSPGIGAPCFQNYVEFKVWNSHSCVSVCAAPSISANSAKRIELLVLSFLQACSLTRKKRPVSFLRRSSAYETSYIIVLNWHDNQSVFEEFEDGARNSRQWLWCCADCTANR